MNDKPKCIVSPRGCTAPVACGGFGYCREKNNDGTPMNEAKVVRLRKAAQKERGDI